jgi:RNA polymerase sigma-70 factor (ECF subfamily)
MPRDGDNLGAGCAHAEPRHDGHERRRIRGALGRRIGDRRSHVRPAIPAAGVPAGLELTGVQFVKVVARTPRQRRDLEGARLTVRFQAGDQDAFGELYRSYFQEVYRYLCVFLKSEVDAEDLAQKVFLNVLRALPRYEHRGRSFGAWLFSVARNCAFDHLRSSRRAQVTDPGAIDSLRDIPIHDDPWHADRGGDFDLMGLVDALPAVQREVILMKYALDLSNADVACVLGCTPDSVSGIHYRALLALEHTLRDAGHPGAARARIQRGRKPKPLPVPA